MINFIVCEDNDYVRKMNEDLINNLMFKTDFEYKIHLFANYNDELREIIKNKSGKKVYILDVELNGKSGIEIAREIRKYDWESIIVVSTAHTELFPQIFKDKFLLFDFVSKFDNYNYNLTSTLNKIIEIFESEIPFSFNIRKTKYRILYEELLYLLFEKSSRKTIVKTINKEFVVSRSMTSLSIGLPDYFVRINNHCIINKRNLITYTNRDELIFVNGVILKEKINNKEFEQYVLD